MPLPDPDSNPREFLTLIIAAGLFIFRNAYNYGAADAFRAAEEFVAEAERRVGKIEP